MRKIFLWFGAVICATALAEERTIPFDAAQAGKIPAGFRSALFGAGQPGDWKILVDESDPTNRTVAVAQLSQDRTDERYPLLILDDAVFGDFTVTTRFKLVSGATEQMAGIAFRIQNETNFYVVRANGVDNNVRFYKVVNGERGTPIGPKFTVARGRWHELKIECKANEIHGWLDGFEAIPLLADSTFSSGKIGFWTKSDAVSYFGETRIVFKPRVPYAQTVVKEILAKKPKLIGLKIYALNAQGEPGIIASKDTGEVGSVGGEYEKRVIVGGEVFCARNKGQASVVLPLRDRNGEPIAAVRVVLPIFPGATEEAVLANARPIVREMQDRLQSFEELKD
ncbi:MAG: DUF1080 domain-containing protein [Verrucomicrobia bacterium]|nr:MAG: DUF1080 domain-containing protein [Verrucomicrobiota bacterium]